MTRTLSVRTGMAVAIVAIAFFAYVGTASALGPICTVPGSYATIQAAVNDLGCTTVNVATGTYPESQIVINRAIQVMGAGAATTIIDGGSATNLSNVGLVRITASGNVTFDGFTLKNVGVDPAQIGNSLMPVRVGVYAASPVGGVTYTISNNKIIGTNNPLDEEDYGFYSNGGLESLVFQNNAISKTGSNPILLERHYGSTNVSNNTWDRGVADGSVDGYFNMNYGGTNITTLQKVNGNTIAMDSDVGPFDNAHRSFGITFAGDFTGAGTAGGFTNVEITNNTINNLKAFRRGIGLWNNGPGSGASGNFTGVTISGNTITGSGLTPPTGSQGIRLLGLATGVNINHNIVSNVDISFNGQVWNGHIAAGTTVNRNSFTNDSTGLVWGGAPSLDATCNWWGSASGPGGPAGLGTGDGVSTNVTFQPWLTSSNLNGLCNGPLPPRNINSTSITFTITNRGSIDNTTSARSHTGDNTALGSTGGTGGTGGDVTSAGAENNGGASAGNGGNGGNGGAGGLVNTGDATAEAGTENDLNGTDAGVDLGDCGCGDINGLTLDVDVDNDRVAPTQNVINNDTRARARTGENLAVGSTGGDAGNGGEVNGGTGNENNGGASAGTGGAGGAGGPAGVVFTGNAVSTAGTLNMLNFTRVRFTR